jgi:outer membrane usher protein
MPTTLTWNWFWANHNPVAVFLLGGVLYSCVTAASEVELQEQLMLVDINRQQLNQTVLVLADKTGGLYLSGRDLQRWRFHPLDESAAVEYQGEPYFSLAAIKNLSQVVDPRTLTLLIEVSPEAFIQTTKITQFENSLQPAQPNPGGFFNYDLLATHSTDTLQQSGQFEFGYFNRFGVGIGNVFAGRSGIKRLDTNWIRDYPEMLRTLQLGDAISAPGSWGQSVRFGGVQYGTNFGTQPGYVTIPPQSARGLAVLPSTVDVFINHALVSHQNVPPGPFSIVNLPVITGAGEIQLVVRDLLGREKLITQPFYASQTLLRKGLENYSAGIGWVRENFALNSNDYGSWLASGTYRRGLSNYFTGEIHAEMMQGQHAIGVGGDYMIPELGTLNAYVARSNNLNRRGEMLLVGIERQAQPWSLGARTQWQSSGFSQIGLPTTELAAELSSINLSYAVPSGGALGVAYVKQYHRDQQSLRIATVSYSISLKKNGALSVSAVRNLSDKSNFAAFAMLSISLDSATSLSVNSQSLRGGGAENTNDFSSTLQRNLPVGEGYGYSVQAHANGTKEASAILQNNHGTFTAGVAQVQNNTAVRLNVSGGIVLLDDKVFLSRRIEQSFAVVSIPDYPLVHILADNQAAGQTDSKGNALIPGLRAYDRNSISINQQDLPLDAEIRSLKLEAVPYYRSGIEIKFPIRRLRGATLTIHLENGKPLPVGALVREMGKDTIFTAGYDGEVYVVGIGASSRWSATWGKQSCAFDIQSTQSNDPLPDLGNFICKEITL